MLNRFKDAMPVFFRSILFTSYILTIFKQQNLLPSRKYEKLPSIVIHACKNITEKTCICRKCLARKFGFVYLRFDPLRRKS